MLQVNNLTKHFKTGFLGKRAAVLRGVSFSVENGEIFGFIGPNGAGKTTTFKCILGFARKSGGTVSLMGETNGNVAIKSRIGYLPENPYFYDYLTGEELLRYMGELQGIRAIALKDKIEVLLSKVNMGHARKVQLRKYSKGMLQRIGIAQALINDPDFIILDEPMSGLDPIGRREIKDLILEEKAKGKTILLSSHMLSDVEALCDRVALIMSGRVVRTGTIGELLNEIHTDYVLFLEGSRENVREHVKDLSVELEERAGYLVLKFDEDIKARVFEAIMKTSVEIVSLHPMRKSLEGLFVEEANKNE